jgi:hypothetical protein
MESFHQDEVEAGLGLFRPMSDIFVKKMGDQKTQNHPDGEEERKSQPR